MKEGEKSNLEGNNKLNLNFLSLLSFLLGAGGVI
jgi:hypothetical protein